MLSTAIVKMLRKIQHLSNNNLIKNADRLITSKNIDFEVDWVGKTKNVPPK